MQKILTGIYRKEKIIKKTKKSGYNIYEVIEND
jgi:hypothetical protein